MVTVDVRTQATIELSKALTDRGQPGTRRKYETALPLVLDTAAALAAVCDDPRMIPDAVERNKAKAQILDALLAVHTDTLSRLAAS